MVIYRQEACVRTVLRSWIIQHGCLEGVMSEGVRETSGVVMLVRVNFSSPLALLGLMTFTETFQWTHPLLTGDVPPPCRAHTATLVNGKRIFIFGGGEGPTYYNTYAKSQYFCILS
jgi:hypothetical protein